MLVHRKGFIFRYLQPGGLGLPSQKASLHLSGEAEAFTRRARETGQRSREGFIPIRRVVVPGQLILDSCRRDFTSSWLPRRNVSKPPGAAMPAGRSLYLLKLVPRILTQTCCVSISCIFVSVSTHRNKCQEIGGVGYSSPPSRCHRLTAFASVIEEEAHVSPQQLLCSQAHWACVFLQGRRWPQGPPAFGFLLYFPFPLLVCFHVSIKFVCGGLCIVMSS